MLHSGRLARLARDKHFNLLGTFVNYSGKLFIALHKRGNVIKLFTVIS